jgi:hypothetical protein
VLCELSVQNSELKAPMPQPQEPLDPSALARFGRLELLARLVVEGVMTFTARQQSSELASDWPVSIAE